MEKYTSGMFIGVQGEGENAEAVMFNRGSNDDIVDAIYSLAHNPENQIGARSFRNLMFQAVITMMIENEDDAADFFATLNKITGEEE